MLELSISKPEYKSTSKRHAFDVRVISNDVVDMTKQSVVTSGYLIRKNDIVPDWSTSQVIKTLNISNKDGIIFNSVNIQRELNEAELKSKEAIMQFLDLHKEENTSTDISLVYKQIMLFIDALNILKDKQKVLNLLPINIDNIAFIVNKDTEEDFILSKEAEYIHTVTSINSNEFSIYTFKEWSK